MKEIRSAQQRQFHASAWCPRESVSAYPGGRGPNLSPARKLNRKRVATCHQLSTTKTCHQQSTSKFQDGTGRSGAFANLKTASVDGVVAACYVGRIPNGAKPPSCRSSSRLNSIVIDLKTAKALGGDRTCSRQPRRARTIRQRLPKGRRSLSTSDHPRLHRSPRL
jgi:hypothetical protein